MSVKKRGPYWLLDYECDIQYGFQMAGFSLCMIDWYKYKMDNFLTCIELWVNYNVLWADLTGGNFFSVFVKPEDLHIAKSRKPSFLKITQYLHRNQPYML